MAVDIDIPNAWAPRGHQMDAWSFLERGGKRLALAWHRRAGKDSLALNWTAVAAHQRVGNYWHMLPQQNQARRAIWTARNPHTGVRLIDQAFPPKLRKRTLDKEMMIEFEIGSTWQVLGSDNYDALVGATPAGVNFSEYALSDPNAWALVRPILLENGGWASFISTIRGHNHFTTMIDGAGGDPQWFAQVLPATQTGVFTPEQLEAERLEMIRENGEQWGDAIFRQEYLCDRSAAIRGAYYGREMEAMQNEGRIGVFPWDPNHQVETWWDIGTNDQMVCLCVQQIGAEIRVIDMINTVNTGIDQFIIELNKKRYVFREHLFPHDGRNAEKLTAKPLNIAAEELGLRPVRIVPRARDAQAVQAGINATRKILPRMRINGSPGQPCEYLVNALRSYRANYNEGADVLSLRPTHDWSSHCADAARTGAVGMQPPEHQARMGAAQLPKRRMVA